MSSQLLVCHCVCMLLLDWTWPLLPLRVKGSRLANNLTIRTSLVLSVCGCVPILIPENPRTVPSHFLACSTSNFVLVPLVAVGIRLSPRVHSIGVPTRGPLVVGLGVALSVQNSVLVGQIIIIATCCRRCSIWIKVRIQIHFIHLNFIVEAQQRLLCWNFCGCWLRSVVFGGVLVTQLIYCSYWLNNYVQTLLCFLSCTCGISFFLLTQSFQIWWIWIQKLFLVFLLLLSHSF